MRVFILLVSLLFIQEVAYAQTVSSRTSPLLVDVVKERVKRAQLTYLNVGIEDANSNNTLQKSEQAFIRFTIRNMGKTASRSLMVRAYPAEATPGLQFQDTIQISPIGGGKTHQVKIPLQRTEQLAAGTYAVIIEIREELVFATDQLELNVLAEGE